VLILVLYIRHRKTAKHHMQQRPMKKVENNYRNNQSRINQPVEQKIEKKAPPRNEEAERFNQEQRRRHLDSFVEQLKLLAKNQIWDVDDIYNNIDENLNYDDVKYLAEQIPTPIFATTVWSIYETIQAGQLPNDKIIKIIESGTPSLIQRFIETYNENSSWTVPSTIVERLLSKNQFLLFDFKHYRKEELVTIINRLSVYELLGYRIKPKTADEECESSFKDLKNSTESDDVEITYYESIDTDIVHYLEQYHQDKPEVRALAFAKILAGSTNVIDMIQRMDNFESEEIAKIMQRNYPEEIEALFEVCDSSKIANSFPASYAIKVALQLIECDYADEVTSNYDFQNIPADTYKSIINELTADELLGYNERGGGVYDIIKLFEDNGVEDQELRKMAFDKILSSEYLHEGIDRWDNVTEEEIKVIIERDCVDEINSLLERDDSEEIITNLPEDIAIKVLLGILYPNALDSVKDNYSFDDADVFKKVIDELSADQLIGDDDFDIILIIEDYMSDDDDLRKLAFAKLCQSDNISRAIVGWNTVNEYEIKVIMERNKDNEVNELLGRYDSDDIIMNLPEEIAIKVVLGLVYPDALQTVKDSYQFGDKEAFKKVITELSGEELIGKEDDDIILLIENEMNDDDDLRTLAFAKLCEAEDISRAIAGWNSVTEAEIKVIMERNKDDEVNELLGREDSNDIVTNLSEDMAIKIYLGLLYPNVLEDVKDSYSFGDKEAFKKVIAELSGEELIGKEDDDIILLIENEMNDDDDLRTLAFAKLCEAEDISRAIAGWNSVTEAEIKVIMERNKDDELTELLGRDDVDNIITNLPDSVVIKKHLLSDDENMHDEYFNRIDDDTFRKKVEKGAKSGLTGAFRKTDKEVDVADLSDDNIIRARLQLIDFDECTFDSDDIDSEYSDRIDTEKFRQKVESLAMLFV